MNEESRVGQSRNTFISDLEVTDRRVLWLLGWCAFALIAAEYLLIPSRTSAALRELVASNQNSPLFNAPLFRSIIPQLWWVVGLLLAWVAIPSRLFRATTLPGFSIGLPKTMRGAAVYGAMIALMLPVIVVASMRADFLRTYPLVRPVQGFELGWTLLLLYWACYATILFCTEYLFRGILLFALEPRLGKLAIAVSVMPYALIHVHKPAPEAFAAILAGYILGYMALTTRSIGGGVVVHCAVALTMDLLALARKGAFPTHW